MPSGSSGRPPAGARRPRSPRRPSSSAAPARPPASSKAAKPCRSGGRGRDLRRWKTRSSCANCTTRPPSSRARRRRGHAATRARTSTVDRLGRLALQPEQHRPVAAVPSAGVAERAEELDLTRRDARQPVVAGPSRRSGRPASVPPCASGRADTDGEQVEDADRHAHHHLLITQTLRRVACLGSRSACGEGLSVLRRTVAIMAAVVLLASGCTTLRRCQGAEPLASAAAPVLTPAGAARRRAAGGREGRDRHGTRC